MAEQSHFNPRCKVEVESFHFLKLPVEIRTMIYVLVLAVNEYMMPDPTGLNARLLGDEQEDFHGYSLESPNEHGNMERGHSNFRHSYEIESGLRLIRTCKQIHDEGTSVLYGRNHFRFRNDQDGAYAKSWCELESLPIWLRYIGKENVRKLRTLCIELVGYWAAWSYGEPDFPELNDSPVKARPAGAALVKAFDYLSTGHHLHILALWFPSPQEVTKEFMKQIESGIAADWLQSITREDMIQICQGLAFPAFFRRGDTAVNKALRKLRGVGKLICPDFVEIWPGAGGVMRTIKGEIESYDSKKA